MTINKDKITVYYSGKYIIHLTAKIYRRLVLRTYFKIAMTA